MGEDHCFMPPLHPVQQRLFTFMIVSEIQRSTRRPLTTIKHRAEPSSRNRESNGQMERFARERSHKHCEENSKKFNDANDAHNPSSRLHTLDFLQLSRFNMLGAIGSRKRADGEVCDVHKMPFSIFSVFRRSPELLVKVGDVNEVMDKTIGRLVYRISGTVSAKNYAAFPSLSIHGPNLYMQMAIQSCGVATMHLEILTTSGHSIRITLSTLYEKDPPRFFGRSLRLPLPLITGWITFLLDLRAIVARYCRSTPDTSAAAMEFSCLKKIQVCSNVLVRDIVSAEQHCSSTDPLPKDLAVKPHAPLLPPLDLVQYCAAICVGDNFQLPSSPLIYSPPARRAYQTDAHSKVAANRWPEHHGTADTTATTTTAARTQTNDSHLSSAMIEASPFPLNAREIALAVQDLHSNGLEMRPTEAMVQSPVPTDMPIPTSAETQMETPFPSQFSSSAPFANAGGRLLALDQVLGYRGGCLALLYNGRMLLTAVGANLLMVDLHFPASAPVEGLWKAFNAGRVRNMAGSSQCLLKGHNKEVTLLEVSPNERYLASAESSALCGSVILWDLEDGRRLVTVKPCSGYLQCVAFNVSNSQMVTVGLDQLSRHQIIVWDIALLISTKGVVDAGSGSLHPSILAKQLSEYPIAHIVFSRCEGTGFISCGRENIRLWRVRKGHLPGRPIVLNNYSRGHEYSTVAYEVAAQVTVFFYVASSKGLVLKVNQTTEQVMCAFQLHADAIVSFHIHNNFAVTGGADNRLRVWPLDFSDYLLEARHEGCVSNIAVGAQGSMLAVGTVAGTLGVLSVSEHSYRTALRSHTAGIRQIIMNSNCSELASVSADKTIRVWNLSTGHQTLEFLSDGDVPTCVCWQTSEPYLICGFSSGLVRVFDLVAAKSVLEVKLHASEVVQLIVFCPSEDKECLLSVDASGCFLVCDIAANFSAIFKIQLDGDNSTPRAMVTKAADLIAIGNGSIDSVMVVDTSDWSSQTANACGNLTEAPTTARTDLKATRTTQFGKGSALVGLCFLESEDKSLLIVSETHFVVVPHSCISRKRLIPRSQLFHSTGACAVDSIISKRHDLERICGVFFDSYSNMLLVTFSHDLPTFEAMGKSKRVGADKARDVKQSFAVLFVGLEFSDISSPRLLVSTPQFYANCSGSTVLSIASKLDAFDKIITADEMGCISYWHVCRAVLRDMTEHAVWARSKGPAEERCIIDTNDVKVTRESFLDAGLQDISTEFLPENRQLVDDLPSPHSVNSVHSEDSLLVDQRENAFFRDHVDVDTTRRQAQAEVTPSKFFDFEDGSAASSLDKRDSGFSRKEIGEIENATPAATTTTTTTTNYSQFLPPKFLDDEDTLSAAVGSLSNGSKLEKIEDEFLLSMESMALSEIIAGSRQQLPLFPASTSELLSRKHKQWQLYFGLGSSRCPDASFGHGPLSCRVQCIDMSSSDDYCAITDGSTIFSVHLSTLSTLCLSTMCNGNPTFAGHRVDAVGISADGNDVVAVLHSKNRGSMLLWWNVISGESISVDLPIKTVATAADFSHRVIFASDVHVVVASASSKETTHIFLVTKDKVAGILTVDGLEVLSCGSPFLAIRLLHRKHDDIVHKAHIFIAGISSSIVLAIDFALMKLSVVWKNDVKLPTTFIAATSAVDSQNDCAVFAVVDNRGKIHTSTLCISDKGEVCVRTALCAVPAAMPKSLKSARTALTVLRRSSTNLMFALFIDSDLFMFSVKIDDLSPMTIKSQVHSFFKVSVDFQLRGLRLYAPPPGSTCSAIALMVGAQGQLGWMRCAASGQQECNMLHEAWPNIPIKSMVTAKDTKCNSFGVVLTGRGFLCHHASTSLQLVRDILDTRSNPALVVQCMALSDDSRWLLVGLSNCQLMLFECDSFRHIDTILCAQDVGCSSDYHAVDRLKSVSYLKAAHSGHGHHGGVLAVRWGSSTELHGLPFIVLLNGEDVLLGTLHTFPRSAATLAEIATARFGHNLKKIAVTGEAGTLLICDCNRPSLIALSFFSSTEAKLMQVVSEECAMSHWTTVSLPCPVDTQLLLKGIHLREANGQAWALFIAVSSFTDELQLLVAELPLPGSSVRTSSASFAKQIACSEHWFAASVCGDYLTLLSGGGVTVVEVSKLFSGSTVEDATSARIALEEFSSVPPHLGPGATVWLQDGGHAEWSVLLHNPAEQAVWSTKVLLRSGSAML